MDDYKYLSVKILENRDEVCAAEIMIQSSRPGAFHVTVLDNPHHPEREYTESLVRKYLHRIIADAALALQELER